MVVDGCVWPGRGVSLAGEQSGARQQKRVEEVGCGAAAVFVREDWEFGSGLGVQKSWGILKRKQSKLGGLESCQGPKHVNGASRCGASKIRRAKAFGFPRQRAAPHLAANAGQAPEQSFVQRLAVLAARADEQTGGARVLFAAVGACFPKCRRRCRAG
ncbi:hypothetical protein M011DRAFT_285616 [Sporormia fimetaria CBS 119925]|uniref:Uncharacterized protein n=1 Tax=Sporormia fimetaria CBS 119925 TaxID=1340428 RepID=A0A6A6VJL0_9PLEO|nr:hypothetical protein M011DRAFT_285616 [Sporormia fimetaria CBS 119925]